MDCECQNRTGLHASLEPCGNTAISVVLSVNRSHRHPAIVPRMCNRYLGMIQRLAHSEMRRR